MNHRIINGLEFVYSDHRVLRYASDLLLWKIFQCGTWGRRIREQCQGLGDAFDSGRIHRFAGAQIRNTASVGGNIVTGSPISDVNPLYMAMGALFTVQGHGTEPRHILANDFFLGYRCAAPASSRRSLHCLRSL